MASVGDSITVFEGAADPGLVVANPIESPTYRKMRSRSTMVAMYEHSRNASPVSSNLSRLEPVGADILRMNTLKMTDSRGDISTERETASQGGGGSQTTKAVSVMPSSVPQHIKLAMSTIQLLQIKGEDIPESDTNFDLALKKTGERLELIVNPVPDAQSLGSASVFHMLGRDGAKQPSILYGSLGYVIDYLIAPHVGMQKMVLSSYIPSQLRRPSMNLAARAESGKNIVVERIADWVIRLWDAFLLTYQDACTTEDLVKELVARFTKTTDLKPGASERPISMSLSSSTFVQTSFETSNGHVVVARRVIDDETTLSTESLTSRTARAVLSWMGLVEENRSSASIRANTLLFIYHWLRSGSGPLDLGASKEAFNTLYDCMTSASTVEDMDLAGIARLILKNMRVIQDVCKFDRKKIEQNFGLDFDGSLTRQSADADQHRLREMTLCYASRSLPSWVFRAEPIFKRNPELVAAELTLMTYDLCYRHIHPLMLVTEKARHAAAPVQDMIRLFRVLSYWPLTCIFEEGIKISVRLHRLTFFLSIAEHFRKIGNFHGLFAVMGGLTQPFVSWLFQTSYQGDKVHKKFEDLKRAISSYGDYRVYKADLSHSHGKSRIPFLGVTTRHLSALETENSHSANHPNLYHFARQVARSAAINEFIGGQRHPYTAKSGYAFAITAGPPGASAFQLHPEGVVIGSRHAQHPPTTAYNGIYSQAKLSIGEIDYHVGVIPQVSTPPSFVGSTELPHDEDLRLLLAWHMSGTLTEEAVKEMSAEAKSAQDEIVVNSLEAAGFM